MVTTIKALALAALVACSVPTSVAVDQVTYLSEPTEQAVVIGPGFDHGEVNMVSITGTMTDDSGSCYPGDLAGLAMRLRVTDACSGTHSQRVVGAAFEIDLTGAPGADHERNVAVVEATARGGTTNAAFLAIAGDVAANHGDIYTNDGNVYASGYLAGAKVYSWAGDLEIHHAGGWVSIRTYPGAPDDTQAPGTIAIDVATPALWLSLGDTGWRRLATVP